MFGNTPVQSSWSNPQQNQQQPQQPQQPQSGSVFGQPSAFGSGGGGGGGGSGSSGGGGVSFTLDTFSLHLNTLFSFVSQLLDLVEALAKIHNSNLSRRTRCLETLPPILILHLQQGARRLVSLSHPLFGSFLLISILSGAFGGNNNNPFSNSKPASGFGAFGGGGTSTFGTSSGAFSSATPSQPVPSNTGLFGQTNATGSAFGTGTFGNKPATSAFGPTSCMSSEKFSVI
jgi:nuclear pore complex protein Nup98-Nup96